MSCRGFGVAIGVVCADVWMDAAWLVGGGGTGRLGFRNARPMGQWRKDVRWNHGNMMRTGPTGWREKKGLVVVSAVSRYNLMMRCDGA